MSIFLDLAIEHLAKQKTPIVWNIDNAIAVTFIVGAGIARIGWAANELKLQEIEDYRWQDDGGK